MACLRNVTSVPVPYIVNEVCFTDEALQIYIFSSMCLDHVTRNGHGYIIIIWKQHKSENT